VSLKWLQQSVMTCLKFSYGCSISLMYFAMVQNTQSQMLKTFLKTSDILQKHKIENAPWMSLKWLKLGVTACSKFFNGCSISLMPFSMVQNTRAWCNRHWKIPNLTKKSMIVNVPCMS
jgi:hypothetical protein